MCFSEDILEVKSSNFPAILRILVILRAEKLFLIFFAEFIQYNFDGSAHHHIGPFMDPPWNPPYFLAIFYRRILSYHTLQAWKWSFYVHPAGFSFCNFTGFLAIYNVVTSNNNNNKDIKNWWLLSLFTSRLLFNTWIERSCVMGALYFTVFISRKF